MGRFICAKRLDLDIGFTHLQRRGASVERRMRLQAVYCSAPRGLFRFHLAGIDLIRCPQPGATTEAWFRSHFGGDDPAIVVSFSDDMPPEDPRMEVLADRIRAIVAEDTGEAFETGAIFISTLHRAGKIRFIGDGDDR